MGWCEKCENFHTDNCRVCIAAVNRETGEESTPSYFKEKPVDNVNHPAHYAGKVECIDVMIETQGVEAVKNFCLCNAFKYLWRHNGKEKEVSIDKALWYLNKYVELREDQNDKLQTDTGTEGA